MISVTDATGVRTTRAYDATGALIELKHADLTSAKRSRCYADDWQHQGCTLPVAAGGYDERITDPNGNATTFSFDELGRIVRQVDATPQGGLTQVAYDLRGTLRQVIDPEGGTTAFDVDPLGRVVSVARPHTRLPGTLAAAFQLTDYDTMGNPIRITRPDGCILLQDFDKMGRLRWRRSSAQAPSTCAVDERAIDDRFGYDARGLLNAAKNDHVGLLRDYDGLGRLVRETDDRFGTAVAYQYDRASRLTAKVYPDGSVLHVAHDAAGRPIGISDPTGDTTRYVYDPAGRRLQTRSTASAVRSELAYDSRGRLDAITSFRADGSARPPVRYSTYDAAGNRLAREDEHGVTGYAYDPLHRLVTADPPDAPDASDAVHYAYDRAGNRTHAGRKDAGGQWTAPYQSLAYEAPAAGGPSHRLTEVRDAGGALADAFAYDANGNPISWQHAGLRTLRWDALDRLVSIAGDFSAQYRYDPLGRRIEKTEGGETIRYQYDGLDPVAGETRMRAAFRLLAISLLTFLLATSAATATPGEVRSKAYFGALGYLRAQTSDGWEGDEAQGVLLGEAVAASPAIVGPRSTSLLSSLALAALDTRGRRGRTLAALGLDVTSDAQALLGELSLGRPDALDLASAALRASPVQGFGEEDTRVPGVLDDALALQALAAAGAGAMGADPLAVEDAILYLLETQLAAGIGQVAWPRLDRPDASGEGAAPDVAVTAQVVLALHPHEGTTLTLAPDPELEIDTSISNTLVAATSFLRAATPTSAAERALRALALLEREPLATSTEAAIDELAAMADPVDGSFDGSAYATALAARALARAADFALTAFDTDGDGIFDGPDPDADEDGFCDPGESGGGCSGTDAFPLDPYEHADLDQDGVGDDNADLDDDGDGVADVDEPLFASNARESLDSDGDGIGDTADPDDDGDGVSDVDERLVGLDPLDADSDDDSFRDGLETAAGTNGLDPDEYPAPDGDIHPLGSPDGVIDIRDVLLAVRLSAGDVTVAPGQQEVFDRHADVAPLGGGGPQPDGLFDSGDVVVILRRVNGAIPAW